MAVLQIIAERQKNTIQRLCRVGSIQFHETKRVGAERREEGL
jgi:hypothetical protein